MNLTEKDCDLWIKNKSVNPKTGRKIKISKYTYKKIKKECDKKNKSKVSELEKKNSSEKINTIVNDKLIFEKLRKICTKWIKNKNKNPDTGRKIVPGKKTFNYWQKKCYFFDPSNRINKINRPLPKTVKISLQTLKKKISNDKFKITKKELIKTKQSLKKKKKYNFVILPYTRNYYRHNMSQELKDKYYRFICDFPYVNKLVYYSWAYSSDIMNNIINLYSNVKINKINHVTLDDFKKSKKSASFKYITFQFDITEYNLERLKKRPLTTIVFAPISVIDNMFAKFNIARKIKKILNDDSIKFCIIDFTIMNRNVEGSHATIMFIDKKIKKVYYVDSHGGSGYDTNNYIKNQILSIIKNNYKKDVKLLQSFISPVSMQQRDSYCQNWTLFTLVLVLTNYKHYDIHKILKILCNPETRKSKSNNLECFQYFSEWLFYFYYELLPILYKKIFPRISKYFTQSQYENNFLYRIIRAKISKQFLFVSWPYESHYLINKDLWSKKKKKGNFHKVCDEHIKNNPLNGLIIIKNKIDCIKKLINKNEKNILNNIEKFNKLLTEIKTIKRFKQILSLSSRIFNLFGKKYENVNYYKCSHYNNL